MSNVVVTFHSPEPLWNSTIQSLESVPATLPKALNESKGSWPS